MKLEDLMQNGEIEMTANRINTDQIKPIEEMMGVGLGMELRGYLLQYGYLAFRDRELYGINSKQYLNSDMVKQTLYLHQYFPCTKDLIALENEGDGVYILVDSEDNVYRLYSEDADGLESMNIRLFDYICMHFS